MRWLTRKTLNNPIGDTSANRKSRFIEMFGDEGYPITLLADCVVSIDSGKSPKCSVKPREANNPAVLKLSAISSGVYLEAENKELLPDETVASGKEVVAGDILLARKNTPSSSASPYT